MDFVNDVIAWKRDGHELDEARIRAFVDGVVSGAVTSYQASALLMAMVLRGLGDDETVALARAMVESGKTLDLRAVRRPVLDKHSSGGVGDKVTLVLAPLVAACGGVFGKMSGRGLGHTGGTLDKLESIPGFRIQLPQGEFVRQLERIGVAVVSQSERIVPADRLLYALRDVTATIDSDGLIAASIMAKKVASGTSGLVLDIKVGRGAFMADLGRARELGRLCRLIGEAYGRPTTCIYTRMDAPLGLTVGNRLEVEEAWQVLERRGAGGRARGRADARRQRCSPCRTSASTQPRAASARRRRSPTAAPPSTSSAGASSRAAAGSRASSIAWRPTRCGRRAPAISRPSTRAPSAGRRSSPEPAGSASTTPSTPPPASCCGASSARRSRPARRLPPSSPATRRAVGGERGTRGRSSTVGGRCEPRGRARRRAPAGAVRVVGGEWRGRPLAAPRGRGTRPTSDKVREAMFDVLAALPEARAAGAALAPSPSGAAHDGPGEARAGVLAGHVVLDLFAGSGALGIEALSRGAASCAFVENERSALVALRANLERLGVPAGQLRAARGSPRPTRAAPCRLTPGAARAILSCLRTLRTTAYAEVRPALARLLRPLLATGAVLVVETAAGTAVELPWTTVRVKRYGDTQVTFLVAGDGDSAGGSKGEHDAATG